MGIRELFCITNKQEQVTQALVMNLFGIANYPSNSNVLCLIAEHNMCGMKSLETKIWYNKLLFSISKRNIGVKGLKTMKAKR